jgi:hypothetical protein
MWLQVSKGICHEWIEALRREATWSCWLNSGPSLDDQRPALLDPASASKARLFMTMVARVRSQSNATEIGVHISVPSLATIMAKLGRGVRRLTLESHLSTDTDDAGDISWDLDYSAFDQLNLRLDSLTLVVTTWSSTVPRPYLPGLFEASATETTRLASILIGQTQLIDTEQRFEDVFETKQNIRVSLRGTTVTSTRTRG